MSRYVGNYNFTPSKHDLECCSGVKESICGLLPKEGNWNLIYGYDHAVGYFIQFESRDDDAGVIDLDSLFYGLTGMETAIIINAFGASSDILKIHISEAMMDLPFS